MGTGVAGRASRRTTAEAPRPVSTRALADVVAWFVTPTSLVVALVVWFGLTFTAARTGYFGVDYSTLGFSTRDYVVRGADALFVPLALLLLVLLAALLLHGLVGRRLRHPAARRALRRAGLMAAAAGSAAVAASAVAMLRPVPYAAYYLAPPMLLGGGAACAGYGAWLAAAARAVAGRGPRPTATGTTRAASVLVSLVVLLAVFWAFSLYAAALGRGRARALESGLGQRPGVTVLSTRSLALSPGTAVEERIRGTDSPYHYRYRGLRLLIFADRKYFLVPDGWTRTTGRVVVLDDGLQIRLEFEPGGRS